jgi:hypothetical protein
MTASERLRALVPEEQEVVQRCLTAAAHGPFFPDWEFGTLFGLERSEVAALAAAWPELTDDEELLDVAISNAFANLLWYPHHEEAALSRMIAAPREELMRVFRKWRGSDPASYLDALR